MNDMRVMLPDGFACDNTVLALGGELKSSICLLHDGVADVRLLMGDLEQEQVYRNFCAQVDNCLACNPKIRVIALDAHPDYLSSKYAQALALQHGLPLFPVQHHAAHIASVMVEHALPRDSSPVLGVALDGLGWGMDGTFWGGEFLLSSYDGCERLAHWMPLPMLGGSAAVHEPWRNTLAHLLPFWDAVQGDFSALELVSFLSQQPIALMRSMAEQGIQAPLASSCGRHFDAVAAAVGLHRERVSFEAEAAIALEQAARPAFDDTLESYPYAVSKQRGIVQLSWQPMWMALLKDLKHGVVTGVIAAKFHRTVIQLIADVATQICAEKGLRSVALSGGVFQNRLISTHLPPLLQEAGLRVLQHQQLPPHDGGVCVGQAVMALHALRK